MSKITANAPNEISKKANNTASAKRPDSRLKQEIRPINTIGPYLRETFGVKIVKLSLDGGFTCPNRDGSKGTGGCIFCSREGSGELSSDIPGQIRLLSEKWPKVHDYIAYFQSHTSTYGPVEELRAKYNAALDHHIPGGRIRGLAIATRPDCLGDEVLELLSELNRQTYLWVELGLQTIHGDHINRCYPLSDYDKAVSELTRRGIRVVTHLILGLPGETKQMMEESVRYICKDDSFGLKLHMLNIVKGSAMEKTHPEYDSFSSPEEYVQLVCDLLEIIPYRITIHRMNGDVPRKLLIAPEWSYKKRTILNGITREMKRRGSIQGCKL